MAGRLLVGTPLARHDLTDQIPDRIDVALPRSQRPPRLAALVRWHRFDETTYAIGRDELIVDDEVRIGLYSPERCIVDAFRPRHQLGEDLAIAALRRWLRRDGAVPAPLLEMARAISRYAPWRGRRGVRPQSCSSSTRRKASCHVWRPRHTDSAWC
jgi:hypothetical protein